MLESAKNLEIQDTFKVPLHRSKIVYMVFNESTVSTSKRYYFLPDQQLKGNTITGIDAHFYNFFATNFSQFVQVNGLTYNVIDANDLNKIYVNILDKQNRYLLRRAPLASFAKLNSLDVKVYELDLQIDSCYLEFIDSAIGTPLPMVIPFNFMWG